MAQQVCVVLSAAEREQLAAIAADRNRPSKHIVSPARRTPIGRPSSVTFETTTISGLPDTLQRSPKRNA